MNILYIGIVYIFLFLGGIYFFKGKKFIFFIFEFFWFSENIVLVNLNDIEL